MSRYFDAGVSMRVLPEGPWEPRPCVWIAALTCTRRSPKSQLYTADGNYTGWRGGVCDTGRSDQTGWRHAYMRHQQDDGPTFRSPGKARRWVEQMTEILRAVNHDWDTALTMDFLQEVFDQVHGAGTGELARLRWDVGA